MPKRDLTDEDCKSWNANKNINPITNRKILTNSVIYNKLEKKCKSVSEISDKKEIPTKSLFKKRSLTLEDCNKWKLNNYKNPISNYTIKETSPLFQELKKTCTELLKTELKPPPRIEPPKPQPKIEPPKPPPRIEPPKISIDDLYYPDLDDINFREKLLNNNEFNMFEIPKFDDINSIEDFIKISQKFCGIFEKAYYQYLMGQYISTRTPYKSLLIYHSVGVGKTCSAITIAESFLLSHSIYDEPKIWVVMPKALKNSFKEQIFNTLKLQDFSKIKSQCTGETYVNLAHITQSTSHEKVHQRIKKLINSRYKLFTYDAFASFIENEYISKGLTINDKIIIIDEAHNIRNPTKSDNDSNEITDKRIYVNLKNVIASGNNNRIILLSATPMYNEPEDIFDLLSLLVLNDKRDIKIPEHIYINDKLNPKAIDVFKKLANNYISFLKGKNPFSFALKLSPKLSGIPIMNKMCKYDVSGKQIDLKYNNWFSLIKDGIIPSQLSEKQLNYSIEKDVNTLNALQPMNILYDNELGERGFYNFFNRVNDNEPIMIKYNSEYNLSLSPENHLEKYSCKLKKIADIIRNSKGTVVIYSNFIWSGILPMAIVLEHLGFNRYGTNNFFEKSLLDKDRPKYNNIKIPNYCILSSENKEVMGNTTIDNLLKIINSPMNIDGSLIKIILMTPVAGEGLSFSNIREIHILEPWYHFNRIDQIIGRGIRNCSHQQLDIKNKNVSVYMHCAINGYEQETPDINAYRIATRKLSQTVELNKIIRDNAIDCSLMYNINYFSKKLFERLGEIEITTSQNKTIKYNIGDDEEEEPKCLIKKMDKNDIIFKEENYTNFINNLINKLRNIILNEIHNSNNFLSYETINNHFININHELIMNAIGKSIYPNTIIDDYMLIPHENGIHIIRIEKFQPINIKIISSKKMEDAKKEDISTIPDIILKKMMKYKEHNNIYNAIISLYTSLNMDYDTFIFIVKKIIESSSLIEIDQFIANCLYKEGVLIGNKELSSVSSKTSKYIGYCNIFSEKFEPIIYIDGKYRDMNERQVAELISSRTLIEIPNMNNETISWGLIQTDKAKKNNTFKILSPGVSVGKKTGMACTSLKKNVHSDLFNKLGLIDEQNNTKITYCNKIAVELLKIGRMFLQPEYKPTIDL